MLKPLLIAALSLGLLGCSSEKDTQPSLGKVALAMAKARIKRGDVEQVDATKQAPQVTREQMAALGRPVVFVAVPRFGSGVPAVELAVNGSHRTYMGSDQATVTLQGGIVTATRGLLVDLIAQELSINPKSLFQGTFPKTFTKSQRHLTGEGTLTTFEYACAIAPAESNEQIEIFGKTHTARQFTELCRRKKRAFKNSYWIDQSTGVVWQSHQSISKEVGHLVLKRVVN